jgi:hypothetical protein
MPQNTVYKQVKIPLADGVLESLAGSGFSIDYISDGKHILLSLNPHEMETLKSLDLKYEVTIDDLESFYRNRNAGKNPDEILNALRGSKEYNIPEGFSLGSMGGFCTYAEMLDHLSFMAQNYPGLILPVDSIEGETTFEGRPVYWTKISDNPQVNEAEPEVLYTALIHAREPGSMQQMLFFMYYLLENYETDDEIKKLVDQTEMYFIPCINPDGYLYNESTSPDGGGNWRKNRRLIQPGVYGVDCNRNFGYKWGHDDNGSSPDPMSSTYRGPEAFSEPETRLVKTFCGQHEFAIALNYHTWGNFILHPWGYVSYLYPHDRELFQTYGKVISAENHYPYDNAGSLLYLVNGDANDWMYGDLTTKPKCIAFTPEIGTEDDGFWPPIERIVPHCIESLHQNLEAAKLAGDYFLLSDDSPFNLESSTGYLKVKLQRIGLNTSEVMVSIQGLDDHFIETGGPLNIGQPDTLQTVTDSVTYSLRPGIVPGESVKYVVHIESGSFQYTDTIQKVFGPSVRILYDSCNAMDHWESAVWGINANTFYSEPASITDSPQGYYPYSGYSEILLIDTIDLADAAAACLQFYTKWRLDGGNDYVTCRVSQNFGAGWTAIGGKYTATHFVPYNDALPVYYGKQDDWVAECIDLGAYCGKKIMIKFTLNSDAEINKDGFYFDDIEIRQILAENDVQEIFLPEGWNSLSSWLIPEDKNMESLFSPYFQSMLFIRDEDDFFQPQNPANTLLTWNSHDGYQLKLSENVVLQIPGKPEYNRQLTLQSGWNLIPVLSNSPVAVEDLNIRPAAAWELIQEPADTKVCWPAKSIHTLDTIFPGKAYFIKMNQAGTIDF